jgi:HK97 gp10 family phage protein
MIYISPKFDSNAPRIERLGKLNNKGIRYGFYLAGKSLVREAKRLINSPPKTGRLYWVYVGSQGRRLKKPRLHQASAAGEAPANITRKLRDGTDFRAHSSNILEFGNTVKYSKYLELGTVKMAPRPFLIKAIKNDAKNTINYVRTQIVAQINR